MLGVAATRQWRIAALVAGLIATALLVVVGCTNVKDGAPAADDMNQQLVQLERLAALRAQGLLTDAEVEAQKRKILGA